MSFDGVGGYLLAIGQIPFCGSKRLDERIGGVADQLFKRWIETSCIHQRFHGNLAQTPSEAFMRSGFLQAIYIVALSFVVTLNGRAQDTSVPPDVKAFAAQYVAAFNAKDKARLESLNLPQSRACITPENKEIYDAALTMQMRDSVPPGYMLSLMPVNEGNLKAFANDLHFPVKPERELHIDYQYPETNDGGQLVLWLVRQNGRWMGDFPCMTALAIKSYRDNAAAREHYKALAAAIKEPLRSQLLAMLRMHKKEEAETRYQQVIGGDLRTAMLVINALGDEVR